MSEPIRCPRCNARLSQEAQGVVKLRLHGPLVFGRDRSGRAVCRSNCPKCDDEIEVPLRLVDEDTYLPAVAPRQRIVLRPAAPMAAPVDTRT